MPYSRTASRCVRSIHCLANGEVYLAVCWYAGTHLSLKILPWYYSELDRIARVLLLLFCFSHILCMKIVSHLYLTLLQTVYVIITIIIIIQNDVPPDIPTHATTGFRSSRYTMTLFLNTSLNKKGQAGTMSEETPGFSFRSYHTSTLSSVPLVKQWRHTSSCLLSENCKKLCVNLDEKQDYTKDGGWRTEDEAISTRMTSVCVYPVDVLLRVPVASLDVILTVVLQKQGQ